MVLDVKNKTKLVLLVSKFEKIKTEQSSDQFYL